MAPFDVYVTRLTQYVAEMRGKGRQVREIDCPTEVSALLTGLPVRVGSGFSHGIVLRGDTFVELGNPDRGSCSFLLWTDNPSLVRDGRITLIGPDIQESAGGSLPFGQVLIMGGIGLSREEHSLLEQNQYVSNQIEGYMIRTTAQHMWSRVSKKAAEKGFCFETLGRALAAIFKSEVPKVQTVEILFVTSSKEDLEQLDNISRQVQKIARDIMRENWKAKGFDTFECNRGWDCSSCPDKPVCDDIRQLSIVRKKKSSKIENAMKT
jgi:CO dehydrogenase/acetyl-CoA synthase beta subunit